MQTFHSDLRSALQIAATTISHFNPIVTLNVSFRLKLRSLKLPSLRSFSTSSYSSSASTSSSTAASSAKIADAEDIEKKKIGKPLICTADELRYVSVPNTNWRLALCNLTTQLMFLLISQWVCFVFGFYAGPSKESPSATFIWSGGLMQLVMILILGGSRVHIASWMLRLFSERFSTLVTSFVRVSILCFLHALGLLWHIFVMS